jgi:ribonuclease BN (tRNA processing enzyme)
MASQNAIDARGDGIRFLGTAGARFVTMRQERRSAGVLYEVAGARLLVDPGPGSLVHCLSAQPPVLPSELDGVLLTHGHLDHAGDANAIIEAMTHGGHDDRGILFAPREALEGDPVVMRYVRGYVRRVEIMTEGASWELRPGVTLSTPLRHCHSIETYGFRIVTPSVSVSHVADTEYMPELAERYEPCDVLVVHMVLLDPPRRRILHLDVAHTTRLVAEVKPRVAVITHFGSHVLEAGPEAIAERMAQETGVRVVAAHDGMRLPLNPWSF